MTAIFNRIFIRPSVDVEFPEDPLEFTQHVLDLYVSTNLCTEHRTATYSSDNLVKTTKSVWINTGTLDIAVNDPIWMTNMEYTTEYCTQHKIIPIVWCD